MWRDLQEIFVWCMGVPAIFSGALAITGAVVFAGANVLWRIVARAWPRLP